MSKYSIVPILLLSVLSLFGQKAEITGTILDAETSQPLIGAVIMLVQEKDSIMVSYGVSDSDGKFIISDLKKGDYNVQITYVGYAMIQKNLQIEDPKKDISLGNILLFQEGKLLDQVTISAEYIPIKITKDTMEFNADAFKTQPNAVVEDLLKKLPGVEVGSDGAITVKGEEVKAITVDGKDFFGKDPKLATKNLPADAVKKVQIFEKKSKSAEFTGINDGLDEMTINLELKEGRKNGYFGNIMAGIGTDDRYESKAIVNKFGEKTQISLLGGLNNINNSGINVNDYVSLTSSGSGGNRRVRISSSSNLPLSFGPDNNGEIKSGIAGLNLNYQLNPNNKINVSYFYANSNSIILENSSTNQFQQEVSIINNKNSIIDNEVNTHNLNIKYETKLDSFSELTVAGSGNINLHNKISTSSDSTIANTLLRNTSKQDYTANTDKINISTSLNYRKKFRKQGRNFTIDGAFSNSTSDITNDVLNFVYDQNAVLSQEASALQYQTNYDTVNYYNFGGTFTEPISNSIYYTFNTSFRNNRNDLLKDFYDIDFNDMSIRELNDQLSQSLDNRFTYFIGGSSIRIQKAAYIASIGGDYQYSTLKSVPSNSFALVNKTFQYFLPRANFRFENINVRMEYSTAVREPSIDQLQPVIDNSDPLSIYIGNPSLLPEYRHALRINFNKFNQFNFRGFFANIRLGYNKNRITTTTTIDENFIKTRTPFNTKEEKTASANVTYVSPINPVKAKIRFNVNSSLTNGINFVDGIELKNNRWSNGFSFLLENKLKEKMDISIGTRWAFSSNLYTNNENLNTSFINNSYEASAAFYLPKGWTFSSKYEWFQYNGKDFDGVDDIHLWEATINKRLFNDRITVGIRAFDILNQNQGIQRTASETYISEVVTNTIGRFFILNVTYQLSKLGTGQSTGPQHIHVERRQ
ncbi:MAG: outer membrane beta-barrel protein [Saprospiraceae bacterium]